jgi:hypothetical protein
MPKTYFNTNTIENIGAFISGDLLATIVAFNILTDVAKPTFIAIITGILGGFFALLGKDLYKWIKNKTLKND